MNREIKNIRNDNQNWFIEKIKKYQVITFTLCFLLLYRLLTILLTFFTDENLFFERYIFDIWVWAIGIPLIYFLQWLIVIWAVSKLKREELKQKFFDHPIVTIILTVLYIVDLPYRISDYSSGGGIFKIINAFEVIIYYAFISFLWWLLICWISRKIYRIQRYKWHWYNKTIEIIFVVIPIVFKFILGLIVAILFFIILFMTISIIFKYSGQDLKIFNF